jgi:hypothetical protein
MSKPILKRKYKNLYLQIQNYEGYDCGHQMMLTISSDYYRLVKSFNEVADKLSKIDKDCPEFRFELD